MLLIKKLNILLALLIQPTITQTQLLSKSTLYQSLDANFQAQILIRVEGSKFIIDYPNYFLLEYVKQHNLKREDLVDNEFFNAFMSILPEEKITELKSLFVKCVETKTTQEDFSIDNINWRATTTPLLDKNGEVVFLLRSFIRIADQRTRMHETMFENVDEGIFISDLKGKIKDVNSRACEITGYSHHELLLMNAKDFISNKDLAEKPLILPELQNNESLFAKRQIVTKADLIKEVSVSSTALAGGLAVSLVRDITEETKQAIALKQSEQKLKTILETIPTCVKLLDKDLNLMDMNPAGLDIIEANHLADVKGQSVLNLIEDTYKEDFAKLHKSAIKGKSIKFTFKIVTLKNNEKWIETYALPFNSSNTKDGCILAISQDITEQKLANDRLKTSNDRFETAVNATKDCIWDWNAEKNETWVNEGLLKLYGKDQDPRSMSREEFLERIHPEDRNRISSLFDKALKQKDSSVESYYRFQTSTGDYKHFFDKTIILYNKDGSVKRILGAMQDVTSKKLYEQNLERSDKKYRYLFNNNPLPMFIYHFNDLKIADCNQAALEKYGYTRDEFIGLSIKDIRPKNDIEKIEKATNVDINYGDTHQGTWAHLKKSGELMQMELTVNVIEHEGHKSALVLANDSTEKIMATESLRISRDRLKTSNKIAKMAYWEMDFIEFNILWSKELSNMFKIAENEECISFERILDIVHPEDVTPIRGDYESALLNTGVTYTTDFRLFWPDGTMRYLTSTAQVVTDDSGNPLRIEGAFQDRTEREKNRRTIAKQNKRFGKIAWMQSHTVRAPLARIMGLVDLLKYEEQTGKEEILEHILDSCKEFDGIIREIVKNTEQLPIESK